MVETVTPDGFAIRRLLEDGRPAPDLEQLAARAREDPFWAGRLVSVDGQVAALVVQTRDSESATSQQVMEAIQAALPGHEARGHAFKVGQLGQMTGQGIVPGALAR